MPVDSPFSARSPLRLFERWRRWSRDREASKKLAVVDRLARAGDSWLDEGVYGSAPQEMTRVLDSFRTQSFFLRAGPRRKDADGGYFPVFFAAARIDGAARGLLMPWTSEDAASFERADGVDSADPFSFTYGELADEEGWVSEPEGAAWMDDHQVFFWKTAPGAWMWGGVKHTSGRWTVKHPQRDNEDFDWAEEAKIIEFLLRRALLSEDKPADPSPGQSALREAQRLARLLPADRVHLALAREEAAQLGETAQSNAKKSQKAARPEPEPDSPLTQTASRGSAKRL